MIAVIYNTDGTEIGDKHYEVAYGLKPGDSIAVIGVTQDRKLTRKKRSNIKLKS